MSNDAFVGNIFLARSNGASPAVFSRVCQVFGISGLGQTNDQVDTTTTCSGGSKEYAAGLADGAEMTLELNFETGANSAVIYDMIADVQAKRIREFQVEADGNIDGTVDKIFRFAATCISWVLNPSVAARNTVNFGLKITGGIAII